MLACHGAIGRWKERLPTVIALAGNPNVGKSTLFNRLTGMGVTTANYPGTTVEVNLGTTRFRDREVGVMDLPGTYALGAASEDQWVARQALLDAAPDVVVVVVDATRLERNLFLPLQLLDLGFPVVVALNLVDEAARQGLRVDHAQLGRLLGVPVVPTIAVRGVGLDTLMAAALRSGRPGRLTPSVPRYGRDVDEAIERLADRLVKTGAALPGGLPARAVAMLLVEDDAAMRTWIADLPERADVLAAVAEASGSIAERHGEPAPLRVARERHGLAGALAARARSRVRAPSRTEDRLWRLTTAPSTGYPLLALVLGGVLAALFYLGGLASDALGGLWSAYASPVIRAGIALPLGDGVVARTLVWGIDGGINAVLSVGIPYVLTFYLILSLLEDSGYLNSVAFLTDPFMHRLGLHGRAAIPLVAGAGCNVPAILGIRVLATMRERILAATLVCLIPCSARSAVIAGAVARYVGWGSATAVYLTAGVVAFAAGWGLNRLMPGQSPGLVMEMFGFRRPSLAKTLRGTWCRFKDFVFVATPVVLVGSLALGLLYEAGLVWAVARPLAPVVEGWLGLPAVAGLTLLFAVLRKELALQLLVALAIGQYGAGTSDLLRFMNPAQIVTYALVNTIYVPCIATIAVLARELGWRRAIAISALTVGLALVAGGIAHRVLTP